MAVCDQCGNDYDKAFQVVRGDVRRTFDSFECAIQSMAPLCAHCQCRVIGHGVEHKDDIYCCTHCAGKHGVEGLNSRV